MAEFVRAGRLLINLQHVSWIEVGPVHTFVYTNAGNPEDGSVKLETEEAAEFLEYVHYRSSGEQGMFTRCAAGMLKEGS